MSSLPSRSLVKATFVPSGEIAGRMSFAGLFVSLVGAEPSCVHPVDLELAVAVRLEDDVAGRRGRDQQIAPVARVDRVRTRGEEVVRARHVLELKAKRASGVDAEVVDRVRGAERMPELEADHSARICRS